MPELPVSLPYPAAVLIVVVGWFLAFVAYRAVRLEQSPWVTWVFGLLIIIIVPGLLIILDVAGVISITLGSPGL